MSTLKEHVKLSIALLAGLIFSCLALPAMGEEVTSGDALARELSNPNTSLGSLNFNLDYTNYKGDVPGADNQEAYRLSFQPVFPYPLAEGVNLFARPNIPVLYKQPVPHIGDSDIAPPGGDVGIESGLFRNSDVELGDIGFDVAVGKTFPSKTVLVGGVVGTLDTATDDAVGLGQTLLGPEALIAQIFDWGVLGVLVTHQWDVAGDDDFDTSITAGQYFYTINLGGGWQIQGSPTFSYNHEAADGDEKWTLPIGTGITRVTRIGKTPWRFAVQYWHYVKQSDALGPDFQVRFTFGPVVPLPW